ncbi:MAG: substrate-binding domain-containing protein [Desulfovibrio sp.]|jgi:phosphate transport system substrate-binding protein|nr:substrate-binding domain-containing protein [Desulfovibrio sp.]
MTIPVASEPASGSLPWQARPAGIAFLHFFRVAGLGFLAAPAGIAFLLDNLINAALLLPLSLVGGVGVGWLLAAMPRLPLKPAWRYGLPLAGIWLLRFGFFPAAMIIAFGGLSMSPAHFAPHLYITGLLAGFVWREQRRDDKVSFSAGARVLFCCLLCAPIAVIGHDVIDGITYHKQRGHGFERAGGFSSTDLKPYDPRIPDAVTPRLNEPSVFVIRGTKDLPVLDGAEAAFPVYAAFAGACYADLPPLADDAIRSYDYDRRGMEPLTFTNTIYGFRRLVEGKADIFFGAHPSEEQMRFAVAEGKEFVLTPIAREAFVFFVNGQNPVAGLDTRQIKDVYSGKISNWKDVGGADEAIIAFQRPQGSGSQTVMLRFMGETRLQTPLLDRVVSSMGGSVDRVSEYHNTPSALGYSFRFFLTGMGRKPRIRMLSLDGVPPTPETIASGQYPCVVDLYAVTVKNNPNPHIQPFLDWMRGPQGQELVEKTGYVKIASP